MSRMVVLSPECRERGGALRRRVAGGSDLTQRVHVGEDFPEEGSIVCTSLTACRPALANRTSTT